LSLRVAVGADHGGFDLKGFLIRQLERLGHEVADLGTHSSESCDYPKFGFKVAKAVAEGRFERGVLVCKSGVGIAIVANRVPGVRAAVCHDAETAALSRRHNDANVLVMGSHYVTERKAAKVLDEWLQTPFEGGRHARRLAQIEEIERKIR